MVARLTFGMTLCGLGHEYNGSHHLAWNNLFPAKYFLGAKRDTIMVSKCLGLTVNDTLYVYQALGENVFNQVLKAYKLQTPSPLSPDWECTGIPGYIDCSICSDRQHNWVGSLGKEWHPFFGYFLCDNCSQKVGNAELNRMEELITQKNDHKMKSS